MSSKRRSSLVLAIVTALCSEASVLVDYRKYIPMMLFLDDEVEFFALVGKLPSRTSTNW